MASRTSLFVNSIQVVSNGNRTHGRADRIEDGFDSDTLAAMATASLSRRYTCAPDNRFLVEIRASSWRVPSGYSRPDENSFSVFTSMPPYSSRIARLSCVNQRNQGIRRKARSWSPSHRVRFHAASEIEASG